MPLSHPYPDLGALDLLVSVSELGSISAAARAHHVTQPAASMRLRWLEDTLQVPLLERSTTGARLTPSGVATVEWAGAVLREVRTLIAGTAALRADRDSHLHVAASLTVAEYLVPRWLERLGAHAPQVKVSLEMGNTAHVIDSVAGGRVELGFIEGPEPPAQLCWQQVAEDDLVIVVGAGHPWSSRSWPLSPQDLAAMPLVLREPGSGTRDVLVEALAEHELGLTPAMELGSTTAIKTAVIGGAGPAAVSALAVAQELRDGQLIAVPYTGMDLRRVIRAVWAAERALSRAAQQLVAIAVGRTPAE
jgi:DNA-binding transcriptional LysR family regulator